MEITQGQFLMLIYSRALNFAKTPQYDMEYVFAGLADLTAREHNSDQRPLFIE